MLFDRSGWYTDNIDFNIHGIDDHNEVSESCSLLWENTMYIFGGKSQPQQIAIVNPDSCQLETEGRLSFVFKQGTCTNLANQHLYLYFNQSDKKLCRYTDNPLKSFDELHFTDFEHDDSQIASSKSRVYMIDEVSY